MPIFNQEIIFKAIKDLVIKTNHNVNLDLNLIKTKTNEDSAKILVAKKEVLIVREEEEANNNRTIEIINKIQI